MIPSLENIFLLEDSKQFDEALKAYDNLYSQNKNDYNVWKSFYFFLWIAIEDAPGSFHDKTNLRHLLQVMFEEGKKYFSDDADFNFIAGYTVSIFPYEFGDYDDLENAGKKLLHKATQLKPDNLIYKMVYLGSGSNVDQQLYRQAAIDAAPEVLETFNGAGALNKYFKAVLIRFDKKAYR